MSRSDRTVPSPILFHGPTSQTRASVAADAWGRVVGVYGNPTTGINAETSRTVATVAATPYVGDRPTAIVVGPIDLGTSDGVGDPLLKVLEEPDPSYPRVHLWAWDEAEVRPTIRSRCLSEWCPGRWPTDSAATAAARAVVRAHLAGDVAGVVDAMSSVQSDWDAPAVFRSMAAELSTVFVGSGREVGRAIALWGRVRRTTGMRVVSWHEALAAVLP